MAFKQALYYVIWIKIDVIVSKIKHPMLRPLLYLRVTRSLVLIFYLMCTTGPLLPSTGLTSDFAAISILSSFSLDMSHYAYLPI